MKTKNSISLSTTLLLIILCSSIKATNNSIDSLKKILFNEKEEQKPAILNKIAFEYLSIAPAKTIEYASKAYIQANRFNQLTQLGYALQNKGLAYQSLRNYSKAYTMFIEAIELFKKANYKIGEADLYNNIGNLECERNNYDNAKIFFSEALELAIENNNKKAEAVSYNGFGIIYRYQGDYKKSIDYFHKSLRIKENLHDLKGMANTLNNIGLIYQDWKDYKKANEYFFKSLEIKNKTGDIYAITSTLINIGIIYDLLNNPDEALKYHNKALEMATKIDDIVLMASAYQNIGLNCIKQKKYNEALDCFNKSLSYSQQLKDKKTEAYSIYNIGVCNFYQANYSQAINYLKKSHQIAQAIKAKALELSTLTKLAQIYSSLKNYELAYEYQKKYAMLKDSLFTFDENKRVQEFQYQYDQEQRDNEIKILKNDTAVKDKILKKEIEARNIFVTTFIFIVLLSFFFYYRYRSRQKTQLIIREQRNKIIESINYAKEIQDSILLPETNLKKIFNDAFIYHCPKDIVSGDFYWFAELDKKTILSVADCTGHGVPGAFMTMLGNILLQKIVVENKITTPSDILAKMDTGIRQSLRQYLHDSELDDGMEMAVCCIYKESLNIEFAGAMIPLYILNNNTITVIKPDMHWLGGRFLLTDSNNTIKPFTNNTLQLNNDTALYMVTDGYLDQFSENNRKKFGIKQFKQLLLNIHKLNMQKQKSELRKTFIQWMGNEKQTDDILLLGIKL